MGERIFGAADLPNSRLPVLSSSDRDIRIVARNHLNLVRRPGNRPLFDVFVTGPTSSSVDDDFTVAFEFAPIHLRALYRLAFPIEHFYFVRALLPSNPTEPEFHPASSTKGGTVYTVGE